MTLQLIDKKLENYAQEMSSSPSPLLNEIDTYTQENVPLPVMLSGYLQGRVLSMLSQMIQPKRILEIGTYTGYSAICLSEGLAPDGKLITIDKNESLEKKTKEYLDRSPRADDIQYISADAKEIIPSLDEEWDLVFIDADKKGYSHYFDLVIDQLAIGKYIIADNVLYNGEVILSDEEKSKNAKAIEDFNIKINKDPRVEQVMLPIRDGLTIIQKNKI